MLSREKIWPSLLVNDIVLSSRTSRVSTDEPAEAPGRAPAEPEQIDYSELSRREIERLIDAALDVKDFDKVRDLAKYLKESKQQDIFEKLHKEMGYPSNLEE